MGTADTALMCGKGGRALLAMYSAWSSSPAAASSDPEMMCCTQERWWEGRGGEMGEAAGRGAEGKITF